MKIAVIVNPYIKNSDVKDIILNYVNSNPLFDVSLLNDFNEINDSFDRVLVFGGDGTILRASKFAALINIPIIGIDLGRLGFLAQFEKNVKSEEIADSLLSNNIESRMLLNCNFNNSVSLAFNEIVVKSAQSKPIILDLFIDDVYVDSYHSDGIIVSTPTGSTAYSLSAGGPVLDPRLDAILIIPICPHSLHSRSMVIPSNSKVEIKLKKYINANVSIDGDQQLILEPEQSVIINKSQYSAQFIINNHDNFYKKLLEKMNKWGITE